MPLDVLARDTRAMWSKPGISDRTAPSNPQGLEPHPDLGRHPLAVEVEQQPTGPGRAAEMLERPGDGRDLGRAAQVLGLALGGHDERLVADVPVHPAQGQRGIARHGVQDRGQRLGRLRPVQAVALGPAGGEPAARAV
jgi:hypothetical protein